MSQVQVGEHISLAAAAATAPYLRLRASAGTWVIAGASDISDAIAEHRALAADDMLTGLMNTSSGIKRMVGAGAIAVDADVWGAASGKVNDVYTAGAEYLGKANTACVADGCIFEVRPPAYRVTPVVLTKTADYTITAADSGKTFDSTGASGAITGSLPAALPGLEYFVRVGAAQEHRLDPSGSETISLPSTGVAGAAGKYLTANAAGETVHLKCIVAGTWNVFGYTGTWTAEA